MKEILEFIFQDIWHFLGMCILLIIFSDIFSARIKISLKKDDSKDGDKKS